MSGARSPSPPARTAGPADASRRVAGSEFRQRGDAFARLLHDKASARDRQCADPEGTANARDAQGLAGAAVQEAVAANAAAPAMLPVPVPVSVPALAPASATPSVPASAPAPSPSATHAALDAALNAGPIAAPLGGADAVAAWEVSVHQPLGVALEMRATRAAGGAADGAALWTLEIASATLDTSALTRHAPRLNERLRARTPAHTHVRIESDDEPLS